VDITRIPGLDQIRVTEEYVEVGAAVTFADLKNSAFINEHFHALADAARSVGALPIQNSATWAGNLVQAMPAADGAIVALALDAEVQIVDREGPAWCPVDSIFRGPGLSAVDSTRQFLTQIRFPRPPSLPEKGQTEGASSGRSSPLPGRGFGSAWSRVGRRASLVLPILNCAVCLYLEREGQAIARAAIALGPVAPRPFRAGRAEGFLAGRAPEAAVLAEAARLAQLESEPRDSLARASRSYRLAVIPPLVETALETALARARGKPVL